MHTAGALFALIRESVPGADLSDRAFESMAKRVIYDNARMEGQKLKTPAQVSKEQQAGAAAASIDAEVF